MILEIEGYFKFSLEAINIDTFMDTDLDINLEDIQFYTQFKVWR